MVIRGVESSHTDVLNVVFSSSRYFPSCWCCWGHNPELLQGSLSPCCQADSGVVCKGGGSQTTLCPLKVWLQRGVMFLLIIHTFFQPAQFWFSWGPSVTRFWSRALVAILISMIWWFGKKKQHFLILHTLHLNSFRTPKVVARHKYLLQPVL